MELNLSVNNTSDIPIYRQLYDEIAAQIIRGSVRGGYCLPPIRTVASELGVSVITVKRTWEELERDGYITTMVGRGCFVKDIPPHELVRRKNEFAAARFMRECPLYRQLGMSRDELHALIDECYKA